MGLHFTLKAIPASEKWLVRVVQVLPTKDIQLLNAKMDSCQPVFLFLSVCLGLERVIMSMMTWGYKYFLRKSMNNTFSEHT